jgi:predicted transcriptional regulator
MYPERADTCTLIDRLEIPPSTIAALAHIAPSKVSEYRRQHDVSARVSGRIERVVSEVADLVQVMLDNFNLRPDLRDIPALRTAIAELKSARAFNSAQAQLAAAESQVKEVLKEFATQ